MANNLYRGTDGIEYVSHGAWSDPELIYDGKSFNYYDIDDALWDMFCSKSIFQRSIPCAPACHGYSIPAMRNL